ncbi:unnamed protein product [Acanthoscelides obtectus]|uniref:HTH CENPB-type domain-containing protein n=1 Tax=Acanthoscelides obtectus TaxID=200917 RepID=A0A9P0MEZ1_ACAOB|nr:unnamed protein product [Acanthoscelides obtectus]CAK1642471.1 hypothetical protein AOBTE_LOCUS13045 [Acanthoscelides obtectus]
MKVKNKQPGKPLKVEGDFISIDLVCQDSFAVIIKTPRTYVRKDVRALWSEEDLRNAIEDLRNGRGSVRQISRVYNVPARTLMRRMRSGNLRKEKLGRKTCLTTVHEASLVNYIQNMEKHGFALTSIDVKKLAFSFAVQNNIPNNFNIDKKQAGHDWFVSFMQRHQELSIRKAQGMSIARAQGMNKEECGRYFDLLGKVLTENDLINTPRKIFNIDESGLQLSNNPDHAFIQQNPDPVPNNDNLEKNVNDVFPDDADNNKTDDPNNGVNIIDDVAVISKTNNPSFEAIAPIPVMPGPSDESWIYAYEPEKKQQSTVQVYLSLKQMATCFSRKNWPCGNSVSRGT